MHRTTNAVTLCATAIGACGDRVAVAPSTTPAEAAAPDTIATSALATTVATRLEPATTAVPRSECERIATAVVDRRSAEPAPSSVVVVRTGTWTDTLATLEVATRTAGGWVCGASMTARVGRSGTRPLLERRSGDGTTPAGVFPLATMTAPDGQRFSFFGNAADPGVRGGAYRRVQVGDCFGATPNTPGYGHLRVDTSCPGPDDEYLPRFVQAYTHAALIGANAEPDVSGDEPGETPYAAAIFLHRHVYVNGGSSGTTKPTSGCVSLAQADLTAVLVDLPSDALFAIGPTDWLLATA